ncbi:MAG TPA: hypothetical protein VFU49_02050 [Ktedonobacteraceae bacterium]|nr:hypothetical protein [Ktedonobacteraceae bacterium]
MTRYELGAPLFKDEKRSVESILENLLPAEYKLELNAAVRVISLLSVSSLCILAQQQFTKNEWRIFMTLLNSCPHYVPYAALLASITALSLQDCDKRLWEAQRQGSGELKKELKPVHRALSGIRAKLNKLSPSLKISLIRNLGYSLTTSQEWKLQTVNSK